MANQSSHQYPALRLILIVANTTGVIFAAVIGHYILLITLNCLLAFILFDGAVFYYQTQVQHLHHFTSSSPRGYTSTESTAGQVDEAASQHNEDAGPHTDDHEPKNSGGANWLILALDTLATIGYITLHILISTSIDSRSVLVTEISMVCFLSAILHGFLSYKALMPFLTEDGSWKFKAPGRTYQAGTVRI